MSFARQRCLIYLWQEYEGSENVLEGIDVGILGGIILGRRVGAAQT